MEVVVQHWKQLDVLQVEKKSEYFFLSNLHQIIKRIRYGTALTLTESDLQKLPLCENEQKIHFTHV